MASLMTCVCHPVKSSRLLAICTYPSGDNFKRERRGEKKGERGRGEMVMMTRNPRLGIIALINTQCEPIRFHASIKFIIANPRNDAIALHQAANKTTNIKMENGGLIAI